MPFLSASSSARPCRCAELQASGFQFQAGFAIGLPFFTAINGRPRRRFSVRTRRAARRNARRAGAMKSSWGLVLRPALMAKAYAAIPLGRKCGKLAGLIFQSLSSAMPCSGFGGFHLAWRSFSNSAFNGNQYCRSCSRSADSSVSNACSSFFVSRGTA